MNLVLTAEANMQKFGSNNWFFRIIVGWVIGGLALPLLAVDDESISVGDQDFALQIPTAVALNHESAQEKESLVQWGGLVPERILGAGPELNERREVQSSVADENNLTTQTAFQSPQMAAPLIIRKPLSLLNPRIVVSKTEIEEKFVSKGISVGKKEGRLERKKKRSTSRRQGKKFSLRIAPRYWVRIPLKSLVNITVSAEARPTLLGRGALEALGAIAAAAAGPAIAAIEAGAQKDIARTNAAAQITMTGIAADVSKYDAKLAADTAVMNAETQKEMNLDSQNAVTQRLGMNLGYLDKAQTEALSFEQKKFESQISIDRELVELAKAKFQFTAQLAMQQFRLQLMLNGLAYNATSSSKNGLSVSNENPQASLASVGNNGDLLSQSAKGIVRGKGPRGNKLRGIASEQLLAVAQRSEKPSIAVRKSRAIQREPASVLVSAPNQIQRGGSRAVAGRSFKGALSPDTIFQTVENEPTHHE